MAEGANMPSEADAIKVYHDSKIMFGPAKVRQHKTPTLQDLVQDIRLSILSLTFFYLEISALPC